MRSHAAPWLLAAVCISCGPASDAGSVLDPLLEAAASAHPAERCVNVASDATAGLGLVLAPAILGGGIGFGALPFPVTVGSIPGQMMSWIVEQRPRGANGQGALHLSLHHGFLADDGVSWFRTDDRAVCAPGSDATACRVNDVLAVVAGGGAFANAGGRLHNHGIIDFSAFSLSISLRGRICGDGL